MMDTSNNAGEETLNFPSDEAIEHLNDAIASLDIYGSKIYLTNLNPTDIQFIKGNKEMTITANEYLDQAMNTINHRGQSYDDDQERSMDTIVRAFNVITNGSMTEQEGWLFMQILKQVRLFNSKNYHEDSALDSIAYGALLAESFSNAQSQG